MNPSTTFSSRLWGLDWSQTLPLELDEVSAEVGAFADALSFVAAHYTQIFGADVGGFLGDPMTDAKRRFGDEMDVLLLKVRTETVGVLLAHPLDWTTYYMRSVAILPAYRDRKLLARLVETTYEPLRAAGVERIEGETAPTNTAMMRALTGLGFLVTSTANSERWGATVRFTKFLREEAGAVFAERFCRTPPARGLSASVTRAPERSPP